MLGAKVPEALNTPAIQPGRTHTEVAVGILLRADGAMLLSTRPAGKVYAGYWEFLVQGVAMVGRF